MLIEKKFTENDIVAIKLVTGEEVLAKLVNTDGGSIIVHRPLTLIVGHDQSGRSMTAVTPFMVALEESARVTFDMTKVVAMGKVRDDLRAQYVKATTGLDVPAAGMMPGINGQI